MNAPRSTSRKAGFTLIELVIVTLVFGVVVSGSLAFMTTQHKAFSRGNGQLIALQNLRYAYQVLEIDLSTLGSNVPAGQPSFVYGGDSVLAFTADHTSNRAHDASAVYINTDLGIVHTLRDPYIRRPRNRLYDRQDAVGNLHGCC